MFPMHNIIKQFKGYSIAVLALLFVALGNSYAEKMAFSLQEAIYKFEMKGENEDAIRILKNVIDKGDEEDRETANFYLGKIQDLAGNKNAANFYYTQSLKRTNETNKAYWLAEREALTSVTFETLLKKKIPTGSPIKRIFSDNNTYLLLNNGNIFKVGVDTLYKVRSNIPGGSEILKINDLGIWYHTHENDSLFYKPHNSKYTTRSFAIDSTTDIFVQGENAIVQSPRTLTILGKKGIRVQIAEKYTGCQIEGFYSVTEHFMVNCPDNALHFISADDGSESYTISLFDAVQKVQIYKKDLFILSGGFLFCYFPKNSTSPKWKTVINNAEDIAIFEDRIAVMEASGRISLLDRQNGNVISALRSDASSMYPLAQGTLGLFTNEGALTAVDTLLRPLWNFNFAQPIISSPIYVDKNIYLIFNNNILQGIAPHYYGMRPLLSEKMSAQAASLVEYGDWKKLPTILDSVFKLEPGNAEAWLFKALYLEYNKGSDKEKQKAWTEAVRHSISNPSATPLILGRYSKAIGAKFVSLLNMSPKTKYPQFFGSKKNLYTIDPAADRLLCINAETGDLRWTRGLPKMDNSPVMAHNETSLAIVSGFTLYIYDLTRDSKPSTVQLPGKAFSMQIKDNSIYISTWNGFLLKINQNENKMAWSRKIFSVPFLFEKSGEEIHLASLDGDISHVWDGSGQIKENSTKLQSGISQISLLDSTFAVATSSNRLYLYNTENSEKPPVQLIMENSIASLQTFHHQDKGYILIGLSDQSILLYSINGAPLWKFQGKGSVFMAPFIHEGNAWIDQGSEVVAINLEDGKVVKKFSTPGGAGTPFILNKTLYSPSSKRLLYGFPL